MERKLVKEIVAFCSTEPVLLKQNRFTKRTEESLLVKRARSCGKQAESDTEYRENESKGIMGYVLWRKSVKIKARKYIWNNF